MLSPSPIRSDDYRYCSFPSSVAERVQRKTAESTCGSGPVMIGRRELPILWPLIHHENAVISRAGMDLVGQAVPPTQGAGFDRRTSHTLAGGRAGEEPIGAAVRLS